MHIRRTSHAVWSGTVTEGQGTMGLGRDKLVVPFSLKSRVCDEPATNPEELIGAAHAGCFAMSVADLLAENGTPADTVTAEATVHLVQGETGFSIPRVDLTCEGVVPGVDEAAFIAFAEKAKATCPVSKLLNAEISLTARLAKRP